MSRFRQEYSLLALRLLSGAGVVHFSISLVIWVMFLAVGVAKGMSTVREAFAHSWSHLAFCCVILCFFLIAFARAKRRRRLAAGILAIAFLLSVIVFVYDTQIAACYQMETLPGGMMYFTWWWY